MLNPMQDFLNRSTQPSANGVQMHQSAYQAMQSAQMFTQQNNQQSVGNNLQAGMNQQSNMHQQPNVNQQAGSGQQNQINQQAQYQQAFHQPVMPSSMTASPIPSQSMSGYENTSTVEMPQKKITESAQPIENGALPRDLLIAKARMFRENQEGKGRSPEGAGAGNLDEAALEAAHRLARETLRTQYSGNQNFEVPAFLRRKQSADLDNEGGLNS
jgi:hypothetical protein